MVLNAAVQMLREADELKQKITKFKSGTSMLQERGLWITQQQLQKVYQKVLVLDLDYALDKKVEQDLWNIGFKQQIEALQAISKDRKNPLRSEGQAMLSWILQAAAGFYLCLLHQICTTFKLDLPFRRRASLLGCVEGWGAGGVVAGSLPAPAAARYICQHCLVHLGDLARYRQQLRIAHTFYRHALVVSAHSGQPYNQLALVAWRRGRRLAALYWHVRSLMVRTPFPPAPANLARTLAAAAAAATGRENKELPVLPGVTSPPGSAAHTTPTAPLARLDAHTYVTELMRVLHMIHTLEDLDTASTLVNTLNSSLTALVATDSFEAMTLVKMSCVLIWIVHSTTDDMSVDSSALSEAEARGAQLGAALAAGAALALLLPAYTAARPPARALPALKVWLSWMVREGRAAGGAWTARPQLWPALAHSLALLARDVRGFDHALYTTVPLPEDEELHGFVPLEHEFTSLRFAEHAAWDTYGGRLPDVLRTDGQREDNEDAVPSSMEVSSPRLDTEPELEHRVRAYRILQLGKKLAQMRPEHLTFTEDGDKLTFTAHASCGEQLSAALAELSQVRGARAPAAAEPEDEDDESEDERPPPPPPIVISEADFREKVREKRIGILKPQGSLERAREERALANTQEDQDGEGNTKCEDKKERKQRVNIAMAAIMRKQEETNKQVKFVTPPLTSDSTTDTGEASVSKEQEKPKIIQPKAIKSLNNLPLGRKTGGILSLKDKSAGYPHLVNTEPELKKPEKEEKKEPKSQGSSQNSQQSFQQKRQDHPPSTNWNANMQHNITLADTPRINFQKNYGIQSAGISYNPSCQPASNQGIRLPVVNPKEIDVRTAALQKQNSRQELFQDGGKFGSHNNHMSGDKKNFLNDLPPRFANQYRYWQNVTENQFNENKFRDDNIINNNNSQQNPYFGSPQIGPKWMTPQINPENLHLQQQIGQWWKSGDNMPKFNSTIPPPTTNLRPNYYSPHASDHSNSYQIMPSFNVPNQNIGLNKTDSSMLTPNYMQSNLNQTQFQTLQNLVTSPNFNSSLNSFGSYAPAVGYDSSMYPQFGNNKLSYQSPQMKMPDKPQVGYEGNKDLMDMKGLNFGTHLLETRQSDLGINFNDSLQNKGYKNVDQLGMSETNAGSSEVPSNTYSLFSGAAEGAWRSGPRPPPSLWSGPGPSPLERLLDQQKHMKQPPQ